MPAADSSTILPLALELFLQLLISGSIENDDLRLPIDGQHERRSGLAKLS
jgi:hypothetical protein